MTKQITIKRNGVEGSASADFVNTQVNGGSANWMPEDEANIGAIRITSNGEYVPGEYGFYGFYAVGVLVPGGNGAETIQQGSLTPTYVTPLPATGLGASVIGVDPTDGAMYRTEIQDVDGVPTLVKTKVADSKADYKPTSMKILIKPAKLSYNDGEKINYAGLVVQLLDSTGYTFVDERFPQGIISWSPVENLLHPEYNLITPIEYAKSSGESVGYEIYTDSNGINAILVDMFGGESFTNGWGTFTGSSMIIGIVVSGQYEGSRATLGSRSSEAKPSYRMYITRYDGRLYVRQLENQSSMRLCAMYIEKEMHAWRSTCYPNQWVEETIFDIRYNSLIPISTANPLNSGASNLKLAGMVIPVRWSSPYDNKIYEDTFEIEVKSSEDASSGSDSSGGSSSGGGGGHSF